MPTKTPTTAGARIQTRKSGVHGKGVFAAEDIAEGATVIEYTGEVISWKEALRRHPHDPAQPNHTFYFHIDDKNVIDGKVTGNAAKWINHACEPNCEADEIGGRIFIRALRDIAKGEELNYDYGLVIDLPYTPELLAEFPCWCGAPGCRGTLLAPKPEPVKKKKKDDDKVKDKAGAGSKSTASKSEKASGKKADKVSGKASKKITENSGSKSSRKSSRKASGKAARE